VIEIESYDLLLSQVVRVVEHVQDDDHAPAELRDCLAGLQAFVHSKQLGERNLGTPKHDGQAWKAAEQLRWFTTEDNNAESSMNALCAVSMWWTSKAQPR
jgi:hypothetical protein